MVNEKTSANLGSRMNLNPCEKAAPSVRVSTLETIFPKDILPAGTEIGTSSVRLFVSLLVGLPLAAEEDTILPIMAIDILRQHSKVDSATLEAIEAKAYRPKAAPAPAAPAPAAPVQDSPVQTSPAAPAPAAPAPIQAPAEPIKAAPVQAPAAPVPSTTSSVAETHTPIVTVGTITGKTTFKDLKSWGLDEEKIKLATGGKIGNDLTAVKDWATANDVVFSELKAKIQALLDAK